jgi:hypothetical protein
MSMGMGAIVWTCLALTVHQSPTKEYFINARNLQFKFHVDEKRRNEVKAMTLLVSTDNGKNWVTADHKQATDKALEYRAPSDGCYWFILQELNQAEQRNPANPSRVRPHQIVWIDTVAPQVTVTTERLASGGIHAEWKVTEPYPDAHSLRLEYHTRAMPDGQFTPLGVMPALEGRHEFNPGRDGQLGEVQVRVQVKDQAGNVGQNVAVVAAPAPAVGAAGGATAAATEGSAFNLIPAARSDQTNPPGQLTSRQTARPALESSPQPFVAAANSVAPPTPPAELSRTGSPPLGTLPVASSEQPSPPAGGTPAAAANAPAIKIVKTREVRLDFTVAKVGPSGLGNADVYVTLDKGGSWKKLPGETPISLPPHTDLHGSEPISGSVGVQLPAEGTIYGFIVAVKSKAGLAPPPPKAGDAPEILVELDTTAPQAKLFKPFADPSQANTLTLSWAATDRNLADNPIVLEWSEQRDGPWSAIGGGPLPNSGQFAWHLPAQTPSRVFLRLTVRDLAGNEARAQTKEPELIDLSVPQTKIIGLGAGSR